MAEDHVLDRLNLLRIFEARKLDHRLVTAPAKISLFIEHVGNTAGHPRGKVAPGLAQHYHATAGHVFTTVIAQGFDHGADSAVTHTKPLTRYATDVGFAACRPVERHVADDHVVFRSECGVAGRVDNDLAARQAFAEVVVCVALEFQRYSTRHKRAETLPGRSIERELNRIGGQTLRTVAPRHRTTKHCADSTIDVADGQCRRNGCAIVEGRIAEFQQYR